MGRKGDCFDNAVVESLFSTLKRELMLNPVFVSRQEGRSQVFEYLEIVYTRQRRHRALGYLTPLECEQRGNRVVVSLQARITEATSNRRWDCCVDAGQRMYTQGEGDLSAAFLLTWIALWSRVSASVEGQA